MNATSRGAGAIAHRSPAPPRALRRLGRAALARATERLVGARGCFFLFHRAVPARQWTLQPNRNFHLDLDYLERLVRHLQLTGWDIVTVSEALRRSARGSARRFVNFSVDDCYRDTAELVVPLFRRLGAPLTLYVTTGIPDETLRLRNAGLETILLERSRVVADGESFDLRTPAQKRAAYAVLAARWDDPQGDDAYLRFCAQHRYDPDALDATHRITWDLLRALSGDPQIEIGAHTVSHPHIAALAPDAAFAELAGCRQRLQTELGCAVEHFAFPFGRPIDCGPRDFALARRAGFASAATTVHGLIGPAADPFSLPRHTLNGAHRPLPLAYAHLTGATGARDRILRRG